MLITRRPYIVQKEAARDKLITIAGQENNPCHYRSSKRHSKSYCGQFPHPWQEYQPLLQGYSC